MFALVLVAAVVLKIEKAILRTKSAIIPVQKYPTPTTVPSTTAARSHEVLDGGAAPASDTTAAVKAAAGPARAWTWFVSRKRYPVATMLVILGIAGLIVGLVLGLPRDGGNGGGAVSDSPLRSSSPPWYPSPKGGTVKNWSASYQKAASLVSRMSFGEKVNVTKGTGWQMGPCVGSTGSTSVGFPSLCLQDGPLGVRFADGITVFPAGVTVAATWSKQLMYQRGRALGREARGKGVNILLGPCIGPIGKHPAGGRNWEAFGRYLQGIAGGLGVRGIQEEGVIATGKHFVGNEQERFRQAVEARSQGWPQVTEALSSNIEERALREVYVWPFMDAVKAGLGSVMCAYNQVNNSYSCQNSYLLNGILKDELGFQGFVMSDWLAQRSGVASALSGMDMSMPGDGLIWADGNWYQLGQDNSSFPDPNFSSWFRPPKGATYFGAPDQGPGEAVSLQNFYEDVRGEHHVLARAIAVEGIVLLKNVNNTLPLKSGRDARKAIRVFGSDAGPNLMGPNGCPDRACNNGTLGQGWGSGSVEYTYQVTPLEALQAKTLRDRTMLEYILEDYDYSRIIALAGKTPNATCLVFVNSDSGEGYASAESRLGDRNDLGLWHDGDNLILATASVCRDTIVIIHSVGPVDMELISATISVSDCIYTPKSWIEHPNVTAVLLAHIPGQESGTSLIDVLYGAVNPSGKLPYTIGKSLEDYGPAAGILYQPNGIIPQQDFSDGIYIDYRHFDKQNITPRFEFGYGLSYTTFEFSNITITTILPPTEFPPARPDPLPAPALNSSLPLSETLAFPENITPVPKFIYPYITPSSVRTSPEYPYPSGYTTTPHTPSPAGGGEGGHPALWDTIFHVDVTVTNTGSLLGKTVAQLYITFPENIDVDTPVRTLRGFEKIGAGPLESVKVGFDILRRDLSYWDERAGNWRIPVSARRIGGYRVFVGESSRGRGVEGVTLPVVVGNGTAVG
ncbi:beta-glucosidase [Rhizina undulata]